MQLVALVRTRGALCLLHLSLYRALRTVFEALGGKLPMDKIVCKTKLYSLTNYFNGQNSAQSTRKLGALATKTSNKIVLHMKQIKQRLIEINY